MARTDFKSDETRQTRLVGSTPTLVRQFNDRLNLPTSAFSANAAALVESLWPLIIQTAAVFHPLLEEEPPWSE